VVVPASALELALALARPQAQRTMGLRSFAELSMRLVQPADLPLLQVVPATVPGHLAAPVVRQAAAPVRSRPAAVQIVSMRPQERRRE